MLHMNLIEEFTNYINSFNNRPQHQVHDRRARWATPFLDTCVIVNDSSNLRTTIYHKPVHTDQYLNRNSNHYLEHKRSVVRPCWEELRQWFLICQIMRSDTRKRPYQQMEIPKKEKTADPSRDCIQSETVYPVCISYVVGVSECLRCVWSDVEKVANESLC